MSKQRMVILGSTLVIVMSLVLGLAVTMSGSSEAQSDSPRLDHFLRYQINTTPFDPIEVGLRDQFDSGKFRVIRPVGLFNPTRKLLPDGTGTGISHPKAHLKGYVIRQTDGEHQRVENLLLTNQFGTFLVDTIRPRLLLVPTAKIPLETEPDDIEAARLDRLLSTDLANNPVDHFKCYGIRTRAMYDTQEMLPFPIHVGLHDQFQEERFEVRRPVLLCNPVAKRHGDIVFPIKNKDAHLMCFEARPRDGEPVQKLARTLNQFGPELLKTVQETQLCVPSKKLRPFQQLATNALE